MTFRTPDTRIKAKAKRKISRVSGIPTTSSGRRAKGMSFLNSSFHGIPYMPVGNGLISACIALFVNMMIFTINFTIIAFVIGFQILIWIYKMLFNLLCDLIDYIKLRKSEVQEQVNECDEIREHSNNEAVSHYEE